MLDPGELATSLEHFSGRVPLFPLPNVALFPYALVPLHIFESRYRQMISDSLDGDGSIALAQMMPGWEELPPETASPIFDVVGVGRIEAYERFPDGRYALILQGLSRARVVSEEQNDLPYRVAQVELRSDESEPGDDGDRDRLCREVLAAFRDAFRTDRLDRLFHDVADSSLPLGMVCDVIASLLSLTVDQSQRLLAEENVERRCALLLGHLRSLRQKTGGQSQPRPFPPDFSLN